MNDGDGAHRFVDIIASDFPNFENLILTFNFWMMNMLLGCYGCWFIRIMVGRVVEGLMSIMQFCYAFQMLNC